MSADLFPGKNTEGKQRHQASVEIPVSTLKKIAVRYGQHQVIVLSATSDPVLRQDPGERPASSWDHIWTWGRTDTDCAMAAKGGQTIKPVLGGWRNINTIMSGGFATRGMKNKPAKNIPIAAAKSIAVRYGKAMVILLTWDAVTGTTHVVTYGKKLRGCNVAAQAGNRIKEKILGWPEDLCKSMPNRIRRKKPRQAPITPD